MARCTRCGAARLQFLPLRLLAHVLTVLLCVFLAAISLVVVARLTSLGAGPAWGHPWLYKVAGGEGFVLFLVFLVWFRRARINAESSGWHQRRGRGWTIGGWIVPVVSLWFPFQIMADIWRASLPPAQRQETASLPGVWWTTWLLATVVNFGPTAGRLPAPGITFADPPVLQHTWTGGLVLLAVSLIALIAIVRRVSFGPLGNGPLGYVPLGLGPSGATGRS